MLRLRAGDPCPIPGLSGTSEAIREVANIPGSGCSIASTWTRSRRVQPDPPGLNSDDPRLLPPWRGSSPFCPILGLDHRTGRIADAPFTLARPAIR
ncbi:hypothetical protein EGT67_17010 [Prescottella agglutinans]|uniref:Uncharacterized protein n=1 Tax=Prescottella agglutinans TaxID=1644129 RepID=A0A3S3AU74_9NOCA|nr:hypothetical protein EGT67_17010 [Prescottella agglutinans]